MSGTSNVEPPGTEVREMPAFTHATPWVECPYITNLSGEDPERPFGPCCNAGERPVRLTDRYADTICARLFVRCPTYATRLLFDLWRGTLPAG